MKVDHSVGIYRWFFCLASFLHLPVAAATTALPDRRDRQDQPDQPDQPEQPEQPPHSTT